MSLIKSHHEPMDLTQVKESRFNQELIDEITWMLVNDYAAMIVDVKNETCSKDQIAEIIIKYLDETFSYTVNRDALIEKVMNYMFGYGPLQTFIEDESISDIDICRYNYIMIKRNGIKEIIESHFESELAFSKFAKLVVIRLGGLLNDFDTHSRVADEKYRLRINVSTSPRNMTGTSMIIRKHRMEAYDLKALLKLDMFNQEMAVLLKKLMQVNSRVLIIGKGGSGKTTLLRALLKSIPTSERFLVCETETELYPESQNFIHQKVLKKNHSTLISLQTLIKDGLTMSLDGYCIGEIIGEELNEFIKAGYTDHRILGTFHAKGVEECLKRMMEILDSKDRSYVLNAFDIIIYMKKFKIMSITQIDQESIYHLFKTHAVKEDDIKIYGSFQKENEVCGSLKEAFLLKSL